VHLDDIEGFFCDIFPESVVCQLFYFSIYAA
jgi:hypothetical protein